jgi:hypothetical protein
LPTDHFKRVIDLANETPLDAREACRHRLFLRGGRPLDRSVLQRWWSQGIKGPGGKTVVLESYRQGGRRLTTAESISRFINVLNGSPADVPSPSVVKQSHARAEAELDAIGI